MLGSSMPCIDLQVDEADRHVAPSAGHVAASAESPFETSGFRNVRPHPASSTAMAMATETAHSFPASSGVAPSTMGKQTGSPATPQKSLVHSPLVLSRGNASRQIQAVSPMQLPSTPLPVHVTPQQQPPATPLLSVDVLSAQQQDLSGVHEHSASEQQHGMDERGPSASTTPNSASASGLSIAVGGRAGSPGAAAVFSAPPPLALMHSDTSLSECGTPSSVPHRASNSASELRAETAAPPQTSELVTRLVNENKRLRERIDLLTSRAGV
jgi:hypothetical protein